MQGSVHMLAGAVAGVSLASNAGSIFVAIIGAMLPDIDTPTSALGKKFPIFSFITGGHRSWTHSLMGLIIFSIPLLFIFSSKVAAVFAIGYISHLLLDMFNPTGIRIFWPIPLNLHLCNIPSKSAFWNSILSIIFGILLLAKLM